MVGSCYCRICKKYSARINCIYILFRFTCNRNYFKWFCSRNSYAYRIYCSVYCGSHSRWYFIRCKRSNGSSTFLRINVCTGNVLYCFTPGDENRNPSFRKSISQFSKKLFHTRNYRWYGSNVSRRFNFNEDICYVRCLYICRNVLFNINNSAQYASALFRKTLSKGGGVNGF
ncbi:hypothetical protein protein [Bacillus cereus G9241]|nr:hypothetical protein protein [Bacillus cereus G9241]